VICGGERKTYRLCVFAFGRQELEQLFERAGFVAIQVYGDLKPSVPRG
jgi:hypothetical protein